MAENSALPSPFMWITERHTPNDVYKHGINRLIHCEQTPFQHMVIADVGVYGRALFLDGALQTSEGDEAYYHEPITHAACIAIGGKPKSVLILGGGDGGTAREVLRWRSVERVVNVEIDKVVVDACRKHLPSLSNGAFDNPLVHLVYDDAHAYLQSCDEKFDVIICDLTDPVEDGPSAKLFALEFFTSLKNHLNPNGAISLQSGTLSLPEDNVSLSRIVVTLQEVFEDVNPMQTFAPKYGTPLALTLATTNKLDLPDAATIDRIFEHNMTGENYMLDGRAVHGLFAIPKCVADSLRRNQKILSAKILKTFRTSAFHPLGPIPLEYTKGTMSDPTKKDSSATDVAKNISTALPNYLVNLAHEPSVGLHYLSTHAKSRVAPSLAQTTRQLQHRTVTLTNMVLDASDATTTLNTHMSEAQEILSRISASTESASDALQLQRQKQK